MRPILLLAATTAFAAPPEPVFRAVTLDAKIQIGYGVAVADVDGDKAPDVLLADKKQFVWYRNPARSASRSDAGRPDPAQCADPAAWTKHLLAENLTEKDNVCLAAQDLDGDGKCEIAVGAEWNPADTEKSGAVFYLIPPADRTQPWEPVKFPAVEPTTHRMKWIKLFTKSPDVGNVALKTPPPASAQNVPVTKPIKRKTQWGLVVVPLHGRGNKNGEGAPVKILCYRKPEDVRGEWKAEVLDESMHATHNMDVFGSDIMLAGKEGVRHVRQTTEWNSRPVLGSKGISMSGDQTGVGEMRSGNLAGKRSLTGGDLPFMVTVEPMHGNRLVLYCATNSPAGSARVLTDQLADGHALACGDLLGTGSDQIVVGWRGNPAKPRPVGIKLFTPLDDAGEKWRESFIDDNEMACEDLVLADLNADGKLDVVASGRATRNVKIYLNETPR